MRGKPFQKGHIPWNAGKNYSGMSGKKTSEETKQKISATKRGKKRPPFSQKWLENLSKSKKGIKFTEEHKRKISLALKEKKHSQEHIRKLKLIRGEKHWRWQGGKTKGNLVQCTNCKKLIWKYRRPKNKDKPFCSFKCFKEYTRGGKHHRWKGGITSLYQARLKFPEYLKRIKEIHKRDGYRCQICGVFPKRIEVHHIIPWRISHNDNPENLITTCPKCHKQLEGNL